MTNRPDGPGGFSSCVLASRSPKACLSSLLQLELYLVSVEVDVLRDGQSTTDSNIVLKRNNDATHTLIRLGQRLLYIAHVALRLTDDHIAHSALLEFHYQ